MLGLIVGFAIRFAQPRAIHLLDDFLVVVGVRACGVGDAIVVPDEVDGGYYVDVVRL